LEVEHCYFPDDVFVDLETDLWTKPLEDDGKSTWRVGLTSTLCFLAGWIIKVKQKTDLGKIRFHQSLGTIESARYFGPIRSPFEGRLSRFNSEVLSRPRTVNESPYEIGWICEIYRNGERIPDSLVQAKQANEAIRQRIQELRVRCFKALPDEELNSIGLECAATLVNLNELLSKKPIGTVVHVVSDDPFGDIEMTRWAIQTRQQLLETRKEGNIFHYIVRKAHD
jgi:glycine cleavage system H protein